MANAASLLVSIGCDAQNFSRGLSRAEKDAKRGFDTIRKAGEQLSMSITLPFIVAAGALAKMAAEAEDASARVDRVFGTMAATVKSQLKEIAGVIPETDEALQNMAVKSDNMLQGLGYGAEKAARLSVEMVRLAGDMAAFAHVPVSEALDALDKGLAGKTRGLIQFGIVIGADQIKLEAMRRGLLDNHRTLTELGTAEIAEMLIRQKATRITGEAERVAGQAGTTFRFLKRDVSELGDKIGGVLLPSVVSLAQGMRWLVEAVAGVTPEFTKFVLVGGAVAATVAPILIGIANLGKSLVALRVAMAASSAISAGSILGGIAAAPFATIATGIVAITAALYGYYRIGRLLAGSDAADEQEAEDTANDKTKTVLRNARHARLKKKTPDGPASIDSRSAIDQFKSRASFAEDSFATNLQLGDGVSESVKALRDIGVDATKAMQENLAKGTIDARMTALEYQKIAIKVQESMNALSVGQRLMTGDVGRSVVAASNFQKSDDALTSDLGGAAIGAETALRMRELALAASNVKDMFDATREATLQMGEQVLKAKNDLDLRAALLRLDDKFNAMGEAAVQMGEQIRRTKNDLDFRAALLLLKDGFDAAKTAAVEFGERLRGATNNFGLAIADFKRQWGTQQVTLHGAGMPTTAIDTGKGRFSNIMEGAAAGLKGALAPIVASFTPMALAAQAFGKIMEGLQPILDAIMGPLVELGRIVGIMLVPIMHPLFEGMKLLGIAVALVGEVIYSVAAGIARVIGDLIVSIGKFISKIPFLGGIGKGIQDFGNGLLNVAKGFAGTAKELDAARRDLQGMKFGDTADAAGALGDAAQKATRDMLNVPQGFKVALGQWRAQLPQPYPGTQPSVPVGGGGGGGGAGSPVGGSPGAGGGAGGGGGGGGTELVPTSFVFNITESKNAKETAREVLKAFKAAANNSFGDSTRWPDLMTA